MKTTVAPPRRENNREIRSRPCATTQCPRCGQRVTLTQETEEWTHNSDGYWQHFGYGPGVGECCGLAFCDSEWDGLMIFDLRS